MTNYSRFKVIDKLGTCTRNVRVSNTDTFMMSRSFMTIELARICAAQRSTWLVILNSIGFASIRVFGERETKIRNENASDDSWSL